MTSLDSLMQELADTLEVPLQTSGDLYSLEMPTSSGRKQTVYVTTRESGVGGDMVLLYTPVGAVTDQLAWRSLLELNVGTIYARTGIIQDQVVIVASQMLDIIEATEAAAMLAEVSALGDVLENLLYGQDKF